MAESLLPSEINDLKYRTHSKSICSERDDRKIKWPIPLCLEVSLLQVQRPQPRHNTNPNQTDASPSSLTTDRQSREQLQFLGRKPELQLGKVTYFPEFSDSANKNANWKQRLQEQTAELLQNYCRTEELHKLSHSTGTDIHATSRWELPIATHPCSYSLKTSHLLCRRGAGFVSSQKHPDGHFASVLHIFFSHSHKYTEKLRPSSAFPHRISETGSSGLMSEGMVNIGSKALKGWGPFPCCCCLQS